MPDSDIQRLVERIERATGPDREIDARICIALGLSRDNVMVGVDGWCINSKTNPNPHKSPFYTASIDAAMTLVPEGAGLSIQRYWIAAVEGPVWSAGISTGGIPSNPRQVFESYDAANAALAIAAAALRARITERTDDE